MTQTFTGSEISPSIINMITEKSVWVLPQMLPTSYYELTTDGEEDVVDELSEMENDVTSQFQLFGVTGWKEIRFFLSQPFDLQTLHTQSGLTWNQLATLFDVTPRMIHYWLNGQKKMSSEHNDTLNQFVRLLSILDLGPAYKVRQFLEQTLLNDRNLKALFVRRDFVSLEKWARTLTVRSRHEELPVSAESFDVRLPERLSDLLSHKRQSSPPPVKLSKARAVRVARRRG